MRLGRPHPRRSCGDLQMLKWAIENGCPVDSDDIIINLAGRGDVAAAKWALDHGCPMDSAEWGPSYTSSKAAEFGHLDMLKFLHGVNCRIDGNVLSTAAMWGHVHILKWLKEEGHVDRLEYHKNSAFGSAAAGGDIETLKWMKENGFDWCPEVCAQATTKPHLLTWLKENGCTCWDETVFTAAAMFGSVDGLKWLEEHGCPSSNQEMAIAAVVSGEPNVLRWMKEAQHLGGVDITQVTTYAISGCQIGVLMWLWEEGYPLPPDLPFQALNRGSFCILKWLDSIGWEFSFTPGWCSLVAGHFRMDMLDWLRRRGCPWDADTCFAAATADNWEGLKSLPARGCPWDERIVNFYMDKGDYYLRWLKEEDAPGSEAIILTDEPM